jgi:hypothetical protein
MSILPLHKDKSSRELKGRTHRNASYCLTALTLHLLVSSGLQSLDPGLSWAALCLHSRQRSTGIWTQSFACPWTLPLDSPLILLQKRTQFYICNLTTWPPSI